MVAKLGHTDLIFIEPDAKINSQSSLAYYREMLLLIEELLPVIGSSAGDAVLFVTVRNGTTYQ